MNRLDRNMIDSYGIEAVARIDIDDSGTDTYQMKISDRVVFVTSAGAGTVYLPPVGEAFGKVYVIQVESYVGAVTVAPYLQYTAKPDSVIYDGSGAETGQALGSDEAFTVLLSTGRAWLVLAFDLDTAS